MTITNWINSTYATLAAYEGVYSWLLSKESHIESLLWDRLENDPGLDMAEPPWNKAVKEIADMAAMLYIYNILRPVDYISDPYIYSDEVAVAKQLVGLMRRK